MGSTTEPSQRRNTYIVMQQEREHKEINRQSCINVILLNSSRINDYQLSTKTALQTKTNVNLDEAPIAEASGGRKSTSQRDRIFD
jgi:hypothetical protein